MSKMDELIRKINKDNEDIISIGLPSYEHSRIPFSSPMMNYCTYGGIPIGNLVEFFGENHGGKTTTALDIVGNYQRMNTGKKVLYLDCENTLDSKWAKKIGVDIDDIYLLQPKSQSAEQLFDYVLDSIATDEIGLVVIDSLGAMVSQQELEKSTDEKTYGGISMPLSRFSKKAEMACHKYNCTIIGINQVRTVIGSMFPMEDTPGGKAWKHLCNVRLQFRMGKYIDSKGNEVSRNVENPAGNIVQMTMIKNKTCPPLRRLGSYIINYLNGIDAMSDYIDLGIKYGFINKRGSFFDLVDGDTGELKYDNKIQGQSTLVELLNTNEDLYNWLKESVMKKMEIDN